MAKATEKFPSLPTEATHRVDVNSRLALRDGPAYLQSSDSAAKDNHIKGKIVDMMTNGTHLIVIDEAVGYNCEWAEVKVVGKNYPQKRLYTSNKFIKKLTNTKNSAEMKCEAASIGNPSAVPIADWTKKKVNEVILDEHTAQYKVTVELADVLQNSQDESTSVSYVSTGGADITNRLRIATRIGLKHILMHTGKESGDAYVDDLMSKTENEFFQFVRASDYFVDTRINSYLKVLVTLPHRYVPPLQDAQGVSTGQTNTLVAWDMVEKVRLRSTYITNEFVPKIEHAAMLLEEYAKDIDNFEGSVIDYDSRTEASRLREVPKYLSDLFKDNKIKHDPFQKKQVLEIGWDETLTPVFASITTEVGETIAMARGMEKFVDSSPIDSQRTQGYVWQLNLISTQKASDRPWTEFINTFTLPDPPAIMPGQSGKENPADITNLEGLSKQLARATDSLPIKTYAEKLSEDRNLGDMDLKARLYENREKAFDFVGSSIASCEGLQKTLDKINTVDDAFSEVLDKISIADLIKQCMDAISPDILTEGVPGLGDIPDVSLDYDWATPNLDVGSLGNIEMMDLGNVSLSSLDLGSVSFADMSLEGMTFGELNLADVNLGSLNISGLSLSSLNFPDVSLGELGIAGLFDELNFDLISLEDIDFGDLSIGDLNLDIGSYTIADLGLMNIRFGRLGFDLNIGDLGLEINGITLSSLGFPDFNIHEIGIDLDGIELGDLTFGDLSANFPELGNLSIQSLFDVGIEFPNLKIADLNLPSMGTIGDFPDFNLNGLRFSSLPDMTIGELGLDGFSISELGLEGFSIGDFGIGSLSFGDLGLENLNMDALGLSGHDLAGLKSKFEELGLSGITEALDKYGLNSLADSLTGGQDMVADATNILSTGSLGDVSDGLGQNLDTTFADELGKARKKLDDLVGDVSLSNNPFEQGTPVKINSLSIELPDNLPTEDIMGSMGDAIEDALTTFLSELFIAMVKSVLEESIGACEVQDSQHEGKENLNDMLDESPNDTRQEDPILGIMAGLGIGLSDDGAAAAKLNPSSDEARNAVTPETRAKVNDMLDDVSLMFTPIELCSLINGKASNRILLLARNFISRKYPEMNLRTRTRVSDFFRAFGNLIDPSICMVIESPVTDAQSPILGDVLCSNDDVSDLRRQILRSKGDDITDDQIEAQLAQARQRKANAAKVLADIVNNGPLSDDYTPPPIVCQKGAPPKYEGAPGDQGARVTPGSGTQAGLIDLTHESIDFAVDKAVDCLFVPLEVAMTNELKEYPDAFVTETEEEESQEVELFIDEGKSVLNPIVQAKYSDAATARAALKKEGDYDGKVEIKSAVRKSMPILYNLLSNIETNELIEYKYFPYDHPVFQIDDYTVDGVAQQGSVEASFDTTFGGFGVSIKMPNMAGAQIRDLENSMSQIQDANTIDLIQAMIDELSAAGNMSLSYILPSLSIPEITSGDGHDNRFLTVVLRGDKVVYRNYSVNELSDDIVEYLDQFTDVSAMASLQTAQAVANQQNQLASISEISSAVSMNLGQTASSDTSIDYGSPLLDTNEVQAMVQVAGLMSDLDSSNEPLVLSPAIYNIPSTVTSMHRFASLIDSRWSDVVNFGSRTFLSDVTREGGIFSNITTDIFAYIGQKISTSPYFQNIQVESPSQGETKMSVSTPAIEFLQLSPEPTGQQQLDGKDTHPLALKTKKDCVKEDIKNGGCVDTTKPTDGSPADELSDPEKQMMKLCIQSTFRTYMIDHYLRSIFSNSVFSAPSIPEDAYKNYIIGHILKSLREYDEPVYVTADDGQRKPLSPQGTYEEDFIEQVISMYEVEESQEPNLEEGESDMESSDVFTKAFNQAIEKEYTAVMSIMKNLISSKNLQTIDKQFITNYLPTFQISDYGTMDSKFFNKGTESLLSYLTRDEFGGSYGVDTESEGGEQVFVAGVYSSIEDLVAQANKAAKNASLSDFRTESYITGRAPINYENGTLYVETYIEVIDHATRPEWWTPDLFGPDHILNIKNRGANFDEYQMSDSGNPKWYKYYGVMTPTDYNEMISDLPVIDGIQIAGDPSNSLFAAVRKGVRVMYLPPTFENDMFSVVFEGGSDMQQDSVEEKELFDAAWTKSYEVSKSESEDVFNYVANLENGNDGVSLKDAVHNKAYKLIEIVDSLRASDSIRIGNAQEAIHSGDTIGTTTHMNRTHVYLLKETNPFPVIDIKEDLTGSQLTNPTNMSLTKITSSVEFKALTEYFFPIYRFNSILALYCKETVSSKREISSALCETKDKLRTIFFALNSKGDYKQKNPALDAIGGEAGLAKMIDNEFDVQDMPAGDNSWNYNMPVGWGKSVKGVGFETVAKATAKAVKKVFKKQVEKSDPNISLAHKLAIASKMVNANIPTLAWTFLVLPANLFPGFPGPPITPLTGAYHALGLGMWKRTRGSDPEGDESSTSKSLRDLGIPDGNNTTPNSASDSCDDSGSQFTADLAIGLQDTMLRAQASTEASIQVQSSITAIAGASSLNTGTGYSDE